MHFQVTTAPIQTVLAAGNALFKGACKALQAQHDPVPYPIGQVAFALLRLREIETDGDLNVFQHEAELEQFMTHYGWDILEKQAAWFAARTSDQLAEMEFVSRQAYPLSLAQAYLHFRQLPVNTAA